MLAGWLRLGLIVVLLGLPLSLETGRAHACVCAEIPPPLVSAAASDIVFTGRAGGTSSGRTKFFDSTVWKGAQAETITIKHPPTSCAYDFRAGQTYVVYAHSFSFRGDVQWTTGQCSGTRRLVDAQDAEREWNALRGTALSPWGVRLLAAGVVALAAAGVVAIRRRSTSPTPRP